MDRRHQLKSALVAIIREGDPGFVGRRRPICTGSTTNL